MIPTSGINLGQLIASLGLDARQFEQAMREAQQQMQKADRHMATGMEKLQMQIGKVGDQMKKVGRSMTMYLTLPIMGAGVASFKLAKDFEKSMSMIVGLVGVAKEQVEEWKDEVIKLGDALGKSPKELADALYFITSAGVKGAEAMQVLEMSAKASVAGLGETKIIADAVTSAINAYGKENITAAEATDVLIAAVREGKAEATGFAGSIGQVIPVASAMGVSFGEIAGVIAGMTRTGTGVETAAMQLKNILATILKGGTKEAERLLKELGSSFEDLRRIVKEEGVLAALLELNRLTSMNADTMSLLFPNIRALTGVLDLLGANLEDNKEIVDKVVHSQGALAHAFATAANTAEFTWQQAIQSVKIALMEFGNGMKDTILPIMQNFIRRMRELTEWFKNLSDEQKKSVIRWAAIAAAVGPVLSIMGNLLKVVSMVNPYITLAVAIGTIVTGLIKWTSSAKRAKDEQSGFIEASKMLIQTNTKINEEYGEQIAEIRKLVWMIESENLSNSTRLEYIQELKKIMPEYNGTLTKEGLLIKHNKDQIDDYIKSLKEKIQLKIYEEEITKIMKKRRDIEQQIEEAQRRQEESRYGMLQYGTGLEGQGMQQLADAQITANEAIITTLRNQDKELETVLLSIQAKMSGQLGKTSTKTTTSDVTPPGSEVTGPAKSVIAGWTSDLEAMNQVIDDVTMDTKLINLFYGIQESIRNMDIRSKTEEMKDFEKQLVKAQTFANTLEGAFVSFFSSIDQGLKGMVQAFGRALMQMAAEMAARATMFLILNALTMGTGGLAKLAGGLLGGKNFKSWMGFAEGGLVYGETLARVGEYPGAKSNPEVIAPLSKLESIIGKVGGGQVVFEIRGDRLVGILQKMDRKIGLT